MSRFGEQRNLLRGQIHLLMTDKTDRLTDRQTIGPTDRQTDRPTDVASYRVVCMIMSLQRIDNDEAIRWSSGHCA